MVSILKKDKNDAYGIRHFLADEEKDIKTISLVSLSPGSTVFVINTSQTFMLSNSKKWVKIKVSYAGGGSGGGGGGEGTTGPDYDGGIMPDPPSA